MSADRPVTLNVWEAVYFDHEEEKLIALAERAALAGVERYVLDDGWFGSRRDDTSGLGTGSYLRMFGPPGSTRSWTASTSWGCSSAYGSNPRW